MHKPLQGKVAVVTGAGRNMGREEALALARAGARVVVNSKHSADETVAAIREIGGEAVPMVADANSWAAGEAIVQRAIDAFGRIDILVNNAGIHRPASIERMSEEDWDAVIAVNLKCYAATIRFAAPHFIAQGGGVIVNTGSTSGLGHLSVANYSAAKEGVLGLTRTVARDLGKYGVRCNMIRPVSLVSDLLLPELVEVSAESSRRGFPSNGVREFSFPESFTPDGRQVAALVLLLCLPQTAHVSGQDFFIMGEEVGHYPEPEMDRLLVRRGGWTTEALLEAENLSQLVGDIRNRYVQ
ncbi:SDR family NAD(P)-dependent oxidoreductase [Haliea sp. E17]|uniref:SDR family NAD(P)-dependent oxidoreductase n=1 Tax=Haliea sp. E17 TaxID=3401576 RepID=UPI003AAF477F